MSGDAGNDGGGPVMDDSYGLIQVVVPPVVQEPLREWLASRGLSLFLIPVEGDDLPTYGIGYLGGATYSPDAARSAGT